MRSVRPGTRREPAGESSGGFDRVRAHAVSGSAPALRQTSASSARPESRARQPHLSTLLHAAGWQDAHRNTYPGHAALRKLHQLAIRARTIDENTRPVQSQAFSHDSTVTVWRDVGLVHTE